MDRKILVSIMGLVTTLYGEEMAGQAVPEAFLVWGALFLLALVGIVILFVSSLQMRKIRKLHKEILQKQQEMEQQQTTLLTNMSENIHDITKEAIKNRNSVMKGTREKSLENVLSEVIHAENTLLDMTNDLIGFLRLKSEKVEIINEKFNLNNVLNEVSGSICSSFQKSNIELIFNIDNNIPRYLIGDSLHLGQILNSLLEHSMMMTAEGEVTLEISRFSTFEEKSELQFRIMDTGIGITPEELESFFEPHYNDTTGEYRGLGLFVAKELAGLMGGELTIQSIAGKGSSFTVVLPLDSICSDDRRNYHLSEKVLTAKKVIIVDNHYNSALAIKKMFTYFRHDVKVVSKDEFVRSMPNLREYDIVVLYEELFNIRVVDYLKKIKRDKELKVIGLSSLLHLSENEQADEIVDGGLQKPLNPERIFDLIVDLYRLKVTKNVPEEIEVELKKEKNETQTVQVHKAAITETKNITREYFADFKGASILIVDDNMVNQKVLTNILDKSGIEITLANNGEEAVDQVMADQKQFDLVLMDIYMPVMDGYTATQKIRDTGRFNHLPIVAFTAFVLDSEVEKVFSSGMNAFLHKPLNLGKLYNIFKMFLDAEITNEKKSISNAAKKEIDGIDIREGIRHASGSEALYIEVLKEFLEAYGESGELFGKLVEEKRFEQIKMLTLDMKGLTGTIGAKDMYREVDEIYKLFIYNNQHELPRHVDVYKKELLRLKQAINQYIEEESSISGIVEVA
ncbi:MAG: response regulator [Campylobacterota bacterium]|nr:response regulator [Campylobacterota bacterium]